MAEFRVSLDQRYRGIFGLNIGANVFSRVAKVGKGLGGAIYPPTGLLQRPARKRAVQKYDDSELERIEHAYEGQAVPDFITLKKVGGDNAEYAIELPVIIRFTRSKVENLTLLNRDFVEGIEQSMVVETSGWGAWMVTVQGMLINNEHLNYPKVQLEEFSNFISHHGVFEVQSELTNAINCFQCTVTGSPKFQSHANFLDTVSFSMQLRQHVSPDALVITE